MTVSNQTPSNSYTYAGSSTFVYGFQILQAGDLLVTVDNIQKFNGIDFTIAGLGVPAGGSITYTSPLTTGQVVSLSRSTTLSRSTDYQDEGDFLAATINADIDRVWMALQEQRLAIASAVSAQADGSVNVLQKGADTAGVVNSLSAFASAFAAASFMFVSPVASSYLLGPNWTPPAQDTVIQMAANVKFTGAKVDFNNLIPYEAVPGPLFSLNLTRKVYGTEWAGQGNIFQVASYAQANLATVPVVALYAQGEAKAANSRVWGLNTGAFANAAGSIAIGYELDIGVLSGGGTAYGLAIASSGPGGQIQNAIQIDANETAAQFIDGLYAHFTNVSSRGCITGAVVNIAGDGLAASTCQRFLYAHGVTATTAEIDLPSLLVDPTVVGGTINRLRVKGGATGVGVLLLSAGETNVDMNIGSHGTGAVGLYDGTLTRKFLINSTGVGFFAAAAKAQVTGWGTPTGASIVTNFNGASASLVNCSNAIAQIIADLKGFGLYNT